ncbi:WXG100 family type VII secretion target [Nocardia puris]|uniref:ESAT-6-like protein n=1 Tax=Nocardia puris TaxID=208602 RepID=A0A366E1Q6_9NOCA|nr:WXG100 family type VII secretion target [Nocardia puris]RBO96301.1 WXG100 family type VII secretion target [Nocardia puris]
MSAEEFQVDLDHLDEVVARLSALASVIAEHLDTIDDKVATLAGTGWEGVAAQAYSDAHREWALGAREFAEGVRDISEAARKAHAGYVSAVEANLKMLRGA